MNKWFGRIAASLLTLSLILSAFPLVSFVFAATYSVKTASDWNTYVVQNASDATAVINVLADIELSAYTESDFAGTINGNGHVITLKTQTALFNELKNGSSVKELGVVVAEDKPIATVGEAGYRGIFANAIDGTVSECFVYGSINVTSANAYIGGFCGSVMEHANISESFSCVSVSTDNTLYTGGFAGIVRSSDKGTASVSASYSAGDIKASSGFVAGFANAEEGVMQAGTIVDTYTSCQLVNLSNDALPSGVNGLYDNQLSLMRESLANPGKSTREMMQSPGLSDAYAVTSTTYPALKGFFDNKWSNKALDVAEISVAAAVFSDATGSSRLEPTDVQTRADYLSYDSYVDRTNTKNLSWTAQGCKIYDTVPVTSYSEDYFAGTGADLLRSRLVFSANAANQKLTAVKNGVSRVWYISAYAANPYFASGDGKADASSFMINTTAQLNNVRFYSLITMAYYKVGASTIQVNDFDPIVDFIGEFNGDNKTLENVTLADDRKGDVGLFANTRSGSTVKNIVLFNAKANSVNDKVTGSLIGSADTTTVTNVIVKGSDSSVNSTLLAGGIIGKATNCTLKYLLVSTEVDAPTAGGLVGQLVGSSLTQSGSTGLVGGSGTVLGGVVGSTGKGNSNASVSYCYSTSMVLTNTDGATVGGLVGNLTSASVTNSYSAGLAAYKNASDVLVHGNPLVGSGTAGSGCTFDGQFYQSNASVVGINGTASYWTQTDGYYPQITYFVDKTRSKDVSLVSTERFYYQHYWEDSASDDSTTAFIPKTFKKPTVATTFCPESNVKLIYTVESIPGFGFEPASNAPFAVVRSVNTASVGVRYAAMIRNDLIPVTFELTGSYTDPVFVSIAYSSDGTNWKETQFRSTNSGNVMYDIPKNSFIRVRVWNPNETELTSVKFTDSVGTITLPKSEGIDYISSKAFSSAVSVVINFKSITPPWGVQRDTV